ncbi:MAG TPA: PA2169 family four-helix-bundle protein [Polyangiaceae bacterium]|nr:PA2169 family four-helix-bundle protein [Polyangiaceae bacterium]
MNPTSDGTNNDAAMKTPLGARTPNASMASREGDAPRAQPSDPDDRADVVDTPALVSVLNGLIEVVLDGARMFSLAAGDVLDADYKALFAQHAQERNHFARELQALVVALGANPQNRGTLEGALLQAWMDVKSAVAVREDYAVLREVERAEQNARKRYARALTLDLGGDVKALVERQYSAVSRSHDRVRALRTKHALRS